MKNLTFTFPLLAVILFFAILVEAASSKTFSAPPVPKAHRQLEPVQGKGDKPAPKPTPTPKPRIGPPKSGDE